MIVTDLDVTLFRDDKSVSEYTKAISNFVCGSNEEKGVAKWLETSIL